MKTDIIRAWEDIKFHRDEWNRLATKPSLSLEWLESCAVSSAPIGRLRILVVFDESVAGVAPLIQCDEARVPTLRLLGNAFCKLYEPSGFIYRDGAALSTLIELTTSQRMPIRIEKIDRASALADGLQQSTRAWINLPTKDKRSVYVSFGKPWDEYESSLKKSFREVLGRKTRKAQKEGCVQFTHHQPKSQSEYRVLLEKFLALEGSGWKERAGTSVRQNIYQKQFFWEYGRRMAERGRLHIFTVCIGGNLAAIRIAVEYEDSLFDLKIAYDEKLSKLSPGILLTHFSIRCALEAGLQKFEFFGEEEDWEKAWSEEVHEYQSLRAYPMSVTGLAAVSELASRELFSRGTSWMQHARAPIGNTVHVGASKT